LTTYEPDILAEGLDVIFCGLNPAASAAAAGHNFSAQSNRFWRVLHLAGFTDIRLQPHDERRLLEYGCGITAVVRRPTRRANEVSPGEFKVARLGFEAKMRHYAPRSIAFLGKHALSAMLGLPKVEWGPFPTGFAGTKAWVLPNPSGLNRGFTLDALVEAYSELRRQL
jgi:TDG/mug DNA glycosylase family protein